MSVPLVLLATTGYGQDFEKEGRSVELDEVTAAPGTTGSGGPHPFDVLGYVLDVRLAMADEHLGGHMLITMLLRSDVDSIELTPSVVFQVDMLFLMGSLSFYVAEGTVVALG